MGGRIQQLQVLNFTAVSPRLVRAFLTGLTYGSKKAGILGRILGALQPARGSTGRMPPMVALG
jgi:hypothetical protein